MSRPKLTKEEVLDRLIRTKKFIDANPEAGYDAVIINGGLTTSMFTILRHHDVIVAEVTRYPRRRYMWNGILPNLKMAEELLQRYRNGEGAMRRKKEQTRYVSDAPKTAKVKEEETKKEVKLPNYTALLGVRKHGDTYEVMVHKSLLEEVSEITLTDDFFKKL